MKIINSLKIIIIFGAFFCTSSAFAYTNKSGGVKDCFKPRFRSFVPPKKIDRGPVPEVEAESEFSFTLSENADPYSLRIKVRDQILKANIVDKNSFFKVTSRLPASLNGKFARINLRVKARRGNGVCIAQDGFLLKVKPATAVVETIEPVVTAPEESSPIIESAPESASEK